MNAPNRDLATTQPVNPARIHAAYNEAMVRVGESIAKRAPRILDYSHAAVCRRLRQRVVYETLAAFMRIYADRPATDRGVLHANGVVVDLSTGIVRVGARRAIRELRTFLVIWLAVLVQALLGTLGAGKKVVRVTVLTGVGIDDLLRGGSDAEFIRFCRRGPVTPLAKAAFLLVQGRVQQGSTDPAGVQYEARPWLALARCRRWTVPQFLDFLRDHLRAALTWFRGMRHERTVALLSRDLAYDGLIRSLNRAGVLENVVTTCTTYSDQFLWMADLPHRHHGFHTIWYSMSFFPKVYADDPVEAVIPDFLHMAAEHSWVWTEGQAAMLRAWGVAGTLHAVGPLLFCLPTALRRRAAGAALTITVFDVTPFSATVLHHHGFIGNYYSAPTVGAFIDGVVRACERATRATGADIRVQFKPKRSYSSTHDQQYIARLRALSDAASNVEMLAPDSNLFDVIQESDAVVAIPYSSPAYVAALRGVPAVYFDPTGRLVPRHESLPHIEFAASEQALCAALTRLLEKRASRLRAH